MYEDDFDGEGGKMSRKLDCENCRNKSLIERDNGCPDIHNDRCLFFIDNDSIEIGDIVKINFNNSQTTLCSKATVLYKPQATGDSWQFKDCATNEIHYVSEECTITKIKNGKK